MHGMHAYIQLKVQCTHYSHPSNNIPRCLGQAAAATAQHSLAEVVTLPLEGLSSRAGEALLQGAACRETTEQQRLSTRLFCNRQTVHNQLECCVLCQGACLSKNGLNS
jgi:hypothetical protein